MATVCAVTVVGIALEEADAVETLTAALEAAEPFRDEMGVDIIIAQEKLERLQRYQKLARSLLSPLVVRQKSQVHEREARDIVVVRVVGSEFLMELPARFPKVII